MTFACCVVSCIVLVTGCSTLAGLGLPGASGNKLLKSARDISDAPGKSLLLPKELAISPLASYIVEISDTISVEPVSFDATIRLPGDQVVKPDGAISLGEFGSYVAHGKAVEQMELEIQAQIHQQIRSDMEVEFAKQQARQAVADAAETKDLEFAADEDFDDFAPVVEEFDSEADDFDSDDEDADSEEALAEKKRKIAELKIKAREEAAIKRAELIKQKREEARRQFEQDLDERLSQNQVSVRVTNSESKKIYVLGEVNSPGSFPYIGSETVLDAIIEAGGLGDSANRHDIIVSRPSRCSDCRTVVKVCYDQIVQLGDASTNYQLKPGDRVFVPSLTFLDDLKQTCRRKNDACPRCSGCDEGCCLPTGCE